MKAKITGLMALMLVSHAVFADCSGSGAPAESLKWGISTFHWAPSCAGSKGAKNQAAKKAYNDSVGGGFYVATDPSGTCDYGNASGCVTVVDIPAGTVLYKTANAASNRGNKKIQNQMRALVDCGGSVSYPYNKGVRKLGGGGSSNRSIALRNVNGMQIRNYTVDQLKNPKNDEAKNIATHLARTKKCNFGTPDSPGSNFDAWRKGLASEGNFGRTVQTSGGGGGGSHR